MTDFSPYIYNDIKKACTDALPNEGCGFVVLVHNHYFTRIVPARNSHEDPQRFFRIGPEEFVRASERGKILAIYHSHPRKAATEPGKPLLDHDRAACEVINIPYLVYSVLNDDFAYYEPSGWMPDLIGRKYIPGIFDCYTLVRDYYREKLKLSMGMYDYDEYWYMDPKQRLIEDNFEKEGFIPHHPVAPRLHDGLLFSFGTPQVTHCAVYVGDSYILHHRHGGLSCREYLSGRFREHLVVLMRHQSLMQPGDERTIAREFK
jgi:cell wall-associated NlpC family hydrolase